MIPVNEPLISKASKKYVLDCLESGWVASGKYIEEFEKGFANFIGTNYALTTSNGTAALHLAVAALGVKIGDEVIVPDLTLISTALAVVYMGATPVLVDVEASTGNIDPDKIEEKITKNTKAIMVVHLYGQPAEMNPILKIARKHKLAVIEDAAEAHGAEVKINAGWKKVGSIGDVGCFSFYGNKIVTSGEGGMVTTNDEKIYQKVKSLRDLAHDPKKRFFHKEIGFSYRMSNLQAALGLGQLEEAEKYLAKKRWMAKLYEQRLSTIEELELPFEQPGTKSVWWMYAVRLQAIGNRLQRDKLLQILKQKGVDTREFFVPLHLQPALLKLGLFKGEKYPMSLDLSKRGFYIPSGLAITEKQINEVVKALKESIYSLSS
ncbi:DegT/DnrJ/EryC1/StrS family aminotransferase [Candidatus Daviesbacteria bacterium]|nr:DegT/DnrJ/EryC1/StrS family aminotransferase [Candidatus Daviesbacteria bacterium]